MDRQRFDSLTRAMATGKSRREMLKLLVGGAAGVAVATAVIDEAAAECHGNACSSDAECCTGAPVCSGGACAVAMSTGGDSGGGDTGGGTESVSAVPAAGVGPGDSDSNAWLGVAVAGGAAALAGAKLLRRQPESTGEEA